MRSPLWAGDWPVTQPWGPTSLQVEPLYGTIHWHCGVDVGMPTGTAIFAAQAGIVSKTGFGVLGIQAGGECHYYIHIDRAVVGLWSAVATGQLIAYSGARVPAGGYLTGPHLHFERNPQALNSPPGLDPMPVLTGRYGPGSAGQGDDMTAEESALLKLVATRVDQIIQLIVNGSDAAVQKDGLTSYAARVLKPELDKLQADPISGTYTVSKTAPGG